MSRLLILGAGGHGEVVADVAVETGRWDDISFLDDKEDLEEAMGFPVLGKLEEYKSFGGDFQDVFVLFSIPGRKGNIWLMLLIRPVQDRRRLTGFGIRI